LQRIDRFLKRTGKEPVVQGRFLDQFFDFLKNSGKKWFFDF
jgi:hypothetical protein